MRTTDFEPMLPKLVAARFPTVKDFRVDGLAENVQPVEYEDGRGRKANEWPPVARWRVGSMRYSYVLKPRFVAERWQMTPLFGGTHVRADYSDEDEKLWQLLQWSVEGKDADEINRLLGNRQPNDRAELRPAAREE